MALLFLALRIILATLFLSTSLSKIRNVEEHIAIIKEYKLLPERWVRSAGYLEMYLELMVGILLLLGLFQRFAFLVAAGLLFIFTFAIILNLWRGRTKISCGCGGIAGTHHLSWRLVVRNVILLLVMIGLWNNPMKVGSIDGLIQGASWENIFHIRIFVTIFFTWAFLSLVTLGNYMRQMKHGMNRLLGLDEK